MRMCMKINSSDIQNNSGCLKGEGRVAGIEKQEDLLLLYTLYLLGGRGWGAPCTACGILSSPGIESDLGSESIEV